MSLTTYNFRHAVSAFAEMPTELAAKILPSHLRPLEVQHGSGIFAVTAFDFTDSMVGPYQEIVMAVIVPPLAKSEHQFPKAAFYPFLLGTSTRESREHAIKRWHLPHYMENISVDFEEAKDRMGVHVHEDGRPILDFEVTVHKWNIVEQLYQSFMIDEDRSFKVDIHMQGSFTVHEDEKGKLELYDHPMCDRLDLEEIDNIPFRELWMRNGTQVFEKLETLETLQP
jgi:hypothetical protein